MFKKQTIGKKIVLGFLSVLILLVVVGGIAYYGLHNAAHGFTSYREMARDTNLMSRLQANMLMARMNVKSFLISGKDTDYQAFNEYWQKMRAYQETAQEEINDPQRAAEIDEIEAYLAEYEKAFSKVVEYRKARERQVNEVLNIKGALMEKTLTDIMLSANDANDTATSYYTGLAMKHLLLARLYLVKYLEVNDSRHVERVKEEFKLMDENIETLDHKIQDPKLHGLLAAVLDAQKAYMATFTEMVETISKTNLLIEERLDRIGPSITQSAENIKLEIKGIQDALGPELVASNSRSIIEIAVVVCMALALGAFLSLIITRSITGPLNRVILGLTEGSEQVASASGQVASASQELAEGSSEQAASLEETSSSLEEITSMTRRNAENANQADGLMKEAIQVVGQANQSMGELTTSMQDISKASDETSKIIKTIDEIAFQTNLLALNAAVEAARAGEAGAGFAVVADEVRNLAMRAAEAAKNTALLIESTVKRVKDGSRLVGRTNEAFVQVEESSLKVGELVGEISAASNEQAQGIDQVSKAVSEMDKVVQQNTANAEENASASEELNAQSEQMNGYVDSLLLLVKAGGTASGYHGSRGNGRKTPASFVKSFGAQEADPEIPPAGKAGSAGRPLIPMNATDFNEF